MDSDYFEVPEPEPSKLLGFGVGKEGGGNWVRV